MCVCVCISGCNNVVTACVCVIISLHIILSYNIIHINIKLYINIMHINNIVAALFIVQSVTHV